MTCYSLLKKRPYAHEDSIWTICWVSPDTLLTGSLDTTARIWKVEKQYDDADIFVHRVLKGFALGVISIDVAPKSSVAAIASMDSKIRLVDIDKPAESCELKTIDAGPVDSWKVRFSTDGRHIATSSISGKINLYTTNVEGETTKTQFDAGKFAHTIDFVSVTPHKHRSPDGKLMAAGNDAGIINVFDLESEKLLTHINGHALPVRTVAFSPDSKILLSGSDDTLIKMHNPSQGEQIRTLSGHGSWILDLHFEPSGEYFASGSSDEKVKIWSTSCKQCVQTLESHGKQVTGVRYDPSGHILASVSDDNTIVIHDTMKI